MQDEQGSQVDSRLEGLVIAVPDASDRQHREERLRDQRHHTAPDEPVGAPFGLHHAILDVDDDEWERVDEGEHVCTSKPPSVSKVSKDALCVRWEEGERYNVHMIHADHL